jgi:hypothetical protein
MCCIRAVSQAAGKPCPRLTSARSGPSQCSCRGCPAAPAPPPRASPWQPAARGGVSTRCGVRLLRWPPAHRAIAAALEVGGGRAAAAPGGRPAAARPPCRGQDPPAPHLGCQGCTEGCRPGPCSEAAGGGPRGGSKVGVVPIRRRRHAGRPRAHVGRCKQARRRQVLHNAGAVGVCPAVVGQLDGGVPHRCRRRRVPAAAAAACRRSRGAGEGSELIPSHRLNQPTPFTLHTMLHNDTGGVVACSCDGRLPHTTNKQTAPTLHNAQCTT